MVTCAKMASSRLQATAIATMIATGTTTRIMTKTTIMTSAKCSLLCGYKAAANGGFDFVVESECRSGRAAALLIQLCKCNPRRVTPFELSKLENSCRIDAFLADA